MFERTSTLLGNKVVDRLKSCHVLLIGLGGVGGYTLECLIRSGVGHITIVDCDVFEESNLNRQILATRDSLGNSKVIEGVKRAKLIYPDIDIQGIDKRLDEKNVLDMDFEAYDYVIDACDTISVKVALMKVFRGSTKLISCMGTANRVIGDFEVVKLQDTYNDPLAKRIRSELKDDKKCLQSRVLWSKTLPLKQAQLGSLCSVVMQAGAKLALYVILDIEKEVNGR